MLVTDVGVTVAGSSWLAQLLVVSGLDGKLKRLDGLIRRTKNSSQVANIFGDSGDATQAMS